MNSKRSVVTESFVAVLGSRAMIGICSVLANSEHVPSICR